MSHQILAQANVLVQPSPLRIPLPLNGFPQGQELAVSPPAAEHHISIKEEEVEVKVGQKHGHHSPGSTRSSDAPSREEEDRDGSSEDVFSNSSSNLSLPTKATRVHSLGQGQGLLLPNYDALLNPFDPVEHAEMSADFLHELQRLFTKKPTAKVPLLVPATERDPVTEESIAKRLSEHLQLRYQFIKKKRSTLLRGMIVWLLIGFTALYASTLIADDTVYEGLLWNLVRLVIDPVGWWACWTGMDNAATYRRHRKRVDKAAALAQLEFVFTDYQVPAAK